MNKNIVHPGNGTDFPKKGDYVKFNLLIYKCDRDEKKIVFEGKQEIRCGCRESNFLHILEELIEEMSLFEKCSLEIEKNNVNNVENVENLENLYLESELILELLNTCKKLVFEVEIVDISKISHQ